MRKHRGFLHKADTNGDHRLSFEEFVRAMPAHVHLRRSLAEDPDRAPDPWLGDVEKVAILVNRTGAHHKAFGSPDDAARGADGHDIHPWSVHRCGSSCARMQQSLPKCCRASCSIC